MRHKKVSETNNNQNRPKNKQYIIYLVRQSTSSELISPRLLITVVFLPNIVRALPQP